jgi:cytochrome c oxidase accessory protein FixG
MGAALVALRLLAVFGQECSRTAAWKPIGMHELSEQPMSVTHPPSKPGPRRFHGQALLGRKRAAFQWLFTLLIIGLPFMRINGESMLRLDFPSLTLHAFGRNFPITDLSLFLLLGISLTLLFLLVTLAFGRAWCGWACPQTTLVDLVEWFARRIGIKVRAGALSASRGQTLVMHGAYLILSLLVGANLVWYFVSPYDFFPQILHGRLHWVALLSLAVVALATYLDLAFLRRLFCKEFCPYGRFQTVLVDPGTLILHYHPDEAPRCIRCGACARSCPTGIDIRDGYQIECINCGRCLDACREVMARRQQSGIIRYTFGLEGRGLAALVNLRMALVAMALLGVTSGLLLVAAQRDPIALKVARSTELMPRAMGADQVINFYTAYLTNRTSEPLTFRLAMAGTVSDLVLSGPTRLQELGPGERRKFDFAIRAGKETLAEPRQVAILIKDDKGRKLAGMNLFLTGPFETHE